MSASIFPEPPPYGSYNDASALVPGDRATRAEAEDLGLITGLARRWHRERRRRKVGRAYDMALEISRLLPQGPRLLDVGCGNGYIAHHLSPMLQADVTGIDLGPTAQAPINYRQFNGANFPVASQSMNAVVICYVLHHAQDVARVIQELQRVLMRGGLVVVYEDIPETWWDRIICAIHDRKWRNRTGPSSFNNAEEWRCRFLTAGFQVISERRLSRWRNLAHPVCRRLFLLKSVN